MFYKLKSKISIELWAISTLFIIGLLIRLYHLGGPSLVDDELLTVLRINHSFWDTLSLLKGSSYPPLHYLILNLWVRAFGNGEWALRFPSALFSGLTVIVIYKLGKELFNKNTGFMAAALLVFSPFAIQYAQFAKMYALFWFLAAVSFLFFFRFLKNQKKNAYVFYIMASVLCCYTMYTGFLLLMAQSLIFLFMGKRARWGQWFRAQLIIVALCLLWIACFLSSTHEDWGLMRPSAAFDYAGYFLRSFQYIIGSAFEIWTHETWSLFSFQLSLWKINTFLYVFLLIYLLADVLTISNKNKKAGLSLPSNYYCLFIWIIFPVFIYFMFDYFVVHVELQEKYIGFIQVPVLLLVASQMDRTKGAARWLLAAIFTAILLSNAYLYFWDKSRFPEQDWRATAGALTHDLKNDDIVVSLLPVSEFKYYYKADTRRFYMMPQKECSTALLAQKGILTDHVHSIFVLYKDGDKKQPDLASAITLDGFSLDYRVWNVGNGFLHYRRIR